MEKEEFILYSTDVPLTPDVFHDEGMAQRAAEQIARNQRGARVSVAKIVASVCEPLPDLKWSDGRPAGDGRVHMDQGLAGRSVMGLNNYAQKSAR